MFIHCQHLKNNRSHKPLVRRYNSNLCRVYVLPRPSCDLCLLNINASRDIMTGRYEVVPGFFFKYPPFPNVCLLCGHLFGRVLESSCLALRQRTHPKGKREISASTRHTTICVWAISSFCSRYNGVCVIKLIL